MQLVLQNDLPSPKYEERHSIGPGNPATNVEPRGTLENSNEEQPEEMHKARFLLSMMMPKMTKIRYGGNTNRAKVRVNTLNAIAGKRRQTPQQSRIQ